MKAINISRKRAASEPDREGASAPAAPSKSSTGQAGTKVAAVQQVLNDEFLPPFSLADFYAFLQKEHSEENIEFYQDIQRYRQRALPIFNSLRGRHGSRASLRSVSQLQASKASLATEQPRDTDNTPKPVSKADGSTESISQASNPVPLGQQSGDVLPSLPDLKPILTSFREELDVIISTYMTEGADKEINLPQSIRRRILTEIQDKHNYHPDLFKGALENVATMMRLSSFPNFLKMAVAANGGEGPVSKNQAKNDVSVGAQASAGLDSKKNAKKQKPVPAK